MLSSHYDDLIHFSSLQVTLFLRSYTGFCRGSKECLQTNMNEHFMPQKCVEIFHIVCARLSVIPVHYFHFLAHHITALAELSLTL